MDIYRGWFDLNIFHTYFQQFNKAVCALNAYN